MKSWLRKFTKPTAFSSLFSAVERLTESQRRYLKDVILPRTLDDATFGALSGLIAFNYNKIVTSIYQNDSFLRKLYHLLPLCIANSRRMKRLKGFERRREQSSSLSSPCPSPCLSMGSPSPATPTTPLSSDESDSYSEQVKSSVPLPPPLPKLSSDQLENPSNGAKEFDDADQKELDAGGALEHLRFLQELVQLSRHLRITDTGSFFR